MDIVLELTDTFFMDYVYAWLAPARPAPYDFPNFSANATAQTFSAWHFKPATAYFHVNPPPAAYMTSVPRDNIFRQALSLYLITWFFGMVVYFVFSALSYWFIFDHKTKEHPKYLKNQISLEIRQAAWSIPGMSFFTAPCFLAEVRGYGKLYDRSADGPGPWYDLLQFPLFLIFTDCLIYLIHRGLHHPRVYKHLHKAHHKWIMPTPFASFAFHPVDGFAQSIPYHLFPFIFPLQKMAYVALFMFVNFWTILIHDGEYVSENPIINGAACHSIHHLAFNYNYGQYTTLWDRLGGSYRAPEKALFRKEEKMSKKLWDRQVEEMEDIVKDVEGEDDRVYLPDEPKKTK